MSRNDEYWGYAAACLLFIGCVLINYKNPYAFVLWIFGNGISLGLHIKARWWSMTFRDFGFLALAIVGLLKWT